MSSANQTKSSRPRKFLSLPHLASEVLSLSLLVPIPPIGPPMKSPPTALEKELLAPNRRRRMSLISAWKGRKRGMATGPRLKGPSSDK